VPRDVARGCNSACALLFYGNMSTFSLSLLALPPYENTSPSRLQALYSDISRQKHSNPTSYHANIEWWRKALQLLVSSGLQQESGSRLVLNAGRSLIEQVRLEGVGKPLALGAVIVRFGIVGSQLSVGYMLSSILIKIFPVLARQNSGLTNPSFLGLNF